MLDTGLLFMFAATGKIGDYEKKLIYLADNIAEDEVWDTSEPQGISILKNYISITFAKCYEQKKILYSDDNENCCINTGLLTENTKDILMCFERNAYYNPFNKDTSVANKEWYFTGFKTTSDRDYMTTFKGKVPALASYTDKVEDYYFNPELPIEIDVEHILEDNWDRVSENVPLPQDVVKLMLNGVVDIAIKRAKRNLRLVIPQFYTVNERIAYLLPITFPIANGKSVTMALAVEKLDGVYRANTIYSRADAYAKARILMKPDTNWLLEK